MLTNYLKIAFKVLLRRKFFTAISLFGIAFTLTMILLAAMVIDHSLSTAAPEVNLDRMLFFNYIYHRVKKGNMTSTWMGGTGYALLDRHARDLPGVEKMAIYTRGVSVATYLDQGKVVSTLRHTDAVYWGILDFDFIEGGPFTAEDERSGELVAVISEATRRRIFGGRPALNERFEAGGQRFRVVGVVRNVDVTRLSAYADLWAPISTRKARQIREDDYRGDYSAMLLVRSRDDFPRIKAEFESRMAHLATPEGYDEFVVTGVPRTRLEEMAGWSGEEGDASVPSMASSIWGGVGGLLLWMLLPTINLVSINMSRIFERASEIGVRKAFGASTGQLVGQFVIENVFLCVVGGGLALIGAVVVRELIQASGMIPYVNPGLNWRIFGYALASACLFGVLSGALPAWRMSRLHPVAALRGGNR